MRRITNDNIDEIIASRELYSYLTIPAKNLKEYRFFKLNSFILELLNKDVYLAGGSLRTLLDHDAKVEDYDLFLRDPEDADVLNGLREELENREFHCVFECPEGLLYTYKNDDGIKVQIICLTKGTPLDIIGGFDISAGKCAFDGEYVYMSKSFLYSYATGQILVDAISHPSATLARLVKYSKKENRGKPYDMRLAYQTYPRVLLDEFMRGRYFDFSKYID